MIRQGDTVRVWPHGREKLAATGRVRLISENQRSIAVSFGDPVPFAVGAGGGVMLHPEYGIMMLATREAVGPWVEITGHGHYEIEAERHTPEEED